MEEVLKAIAELRATMVESFSAVRAELDELHLEITFGRQHPSALQAFEDRVVERVIERMGKSG